MSSFTDKMGREWNLDITVAAMRRAKSQGIDLSMPAKSLGDYFFDDCYLCDALWAIVKPAASEVGLTQEQFELGLDGKTLATAREAIWEAMYEYFDIAKGEFLRSAIAGVAEEMETAKNSLTSSGSGESKGSLVGTSDHTA